MSSHGQSADIFEFDEDQHQREYPKDRVPQPHERYHEGKDAHVHNKLDSKDQRSIKNRLGATEHDNEYAKQAHHKAAEDHEKMETRSKGARLDEELRQEDEKTIDLMNQHDRVEEKHKHRGAHAHHQSHRTSGGS